MPKLEVKNLVFNRSSVTIITNIGRFRTTWVGGTCVMFHTDPTLPFIYNGKETVFTISCVNMRNTWSVSPISTIHCPGKDAATRESLGGIFTILQDEFLDLLNSGRLDRASVEAQASTIRSEIGNVECELERLASEKSVVEGSIDSWNDELARLRKQLDDLVTGHLDRDFDLVGSIR